MRSRAIIQHPRLGGAECPEKYMNVTEPCGTALCGQACANSNNVTGFKYSHNGYWGGFVDVGVLDSVQTCASRCLNDYSCKGFSYIKDSSDSKYQHCYQNQQLGDSESTSYSSEAYKKCNEAGVTDCTYSAWTDWSQCDACNGQRSRTRTFTEPSSKGKACSSKAKSLGETEMCTTNDSGKRSCAGQQHYCAWADWKPYTECVFSKKHDDAWCGTGYKTRERSMVATTNPPSDSRLYDASLEIDDALDRDPTATAGDEDDEVSRLHSLSLAFVFGGVTVGLCMVAMRVGKRLISRNRQHYVSLATSELE